MSRVRRMPRDDPARSPSGGSHVRRNRRFWERGSDEYDRRHRKALEGGNAATWGLWRLPESSLQLLGPVRGKTILELGCGAARWSIELARRGARPLGLDATRAQLEKAARLIATARVRLPIVQANAERIPFADGRFDAVFCDWGAMTFCDPHRTVPECARVLRPGGLLVFATASPLRYIAFDRKHDRQDRRLLRSYFELGRVPLGDSVEFQLPYGRWIDLFAQNGFAVEQLLEPQPSAESRSSYLPRHDAAWARKWPLEAIWRVRKRETTPMARGRTERSGRSAPPRRSQGRRSPRRFAD